MKQFWSKPAAVLIGTQIALPYLFKGVDFSAIVSLDAARSIPTWRADESLFRLLLKLRESTAKEVLVQTRSETDALLTHAVRGALERFYDEEIDLRKTLAYPPYSRFILLTWVGTADAAKALQQTLQSQLGTNDIQYYFNPNSTPQKTYAHALLRLAPNHTPQQAATLQKIQKLPPHIKVEVNPDRIV
jgi:primosomal protein N' (replication factor Y)